MTFDLSDIAERAFKTALEAFLVALPASLYFADLPALQDAAVAGAFAAATAGAAVLVNAVLQYARSEDSDVQL